MSVQDDLAVHVQLVYDPDLVAACQTDLERLLPDWLSLEPEDQQWRLQRFVEKLRNQPQLLSPFRAVLQQQIQSHHNKDEAQPGPDMLIELLKDLKLILDLAV